MHSSCPYSFKAEDSGLAFTVIWDLRYIQLPENSESIDGPEITKEFRNTTLRFVVWYEVGDSGNRLKGNVSRVKDVPRETK